MNPYTRKILENFENRQNEVFAEVCETGQTTSLYWRDLEVECRRVIRALDFTINVASKCNDPTILIFLPHGVALFPVFLGSMLGGYVPSFMPCPSKRQDPDLYWKSHQELIETIKPVGIITNEEMLTQMEKAQLCFFGSKILLAENIEQLAADSLEGSEGHEFVEREGTDIALLQHSSGTTGLKKGVALSYDAIHKHAVSYGDSLNISNEDVIVSWLPLYHDMGLMACFITPSYHGVKTVQISAFDWLNRPNVLFDRIKEFNGTLCWLPNFAFDHMSNTLKKYANRFDLSSIRAFISCSEHCKKQTFERFSTVFSESNLNANALQTCYAMAEVVFAVTQSTIGEVISPLRVDSDSLQRGDTVTVSNKPDTTALVDCGHAIESVEIKIVDENRMNLADGTIGEIAIGSSFLFSGYNKDKVRTGACLSENVYYSNDLGFMLNGKLYVLGRIDDLIIVNGRNIFAHQVEAMASEVFGVKAGRAVAMSHTDELSGSSVLVVMAERDSVPGTLVDDDEIIRTVVARVQSEIDVMPREVLLVEAGSLIKTSSGKMSRKDNLDVYLSNALDQNILRAA